MFMPHLVYSEIVLEKGSDCNRILYAINLSKEKFERFPSHQVHRFACLMRGFACLGIAIALLGLLNHPTSSYFVKNVTFNTKVFPHAPPYRPARVLEQTRTMPHHDKLGRLLGFCNESGSSDSTLHIWPFPFA